MVRLQRCRAPLLRLSTRIWGESQGDHMKRRLATVYDGRVGAVHWSAGWRFGASPRGAHPSGMQCMIATAVHGGQRSGERTLVVVLVVAVVVDAVIIRWIGAASAAQLCAASSLSNDFAFDVRILLT